MPWIAWHKACPDVGMTTIAAKRILVPHDFSATSEAARRYAMALAKALGAALDVLHVSDKTDRSLPFTAGFEVRPGNPSREIDRFARERDVDLIVMGTHGRSSFAQAVVGSVAAKVIRTAPCPVLTVRLPQRGFGLANVLVGVDFEPASMNAVAYGRAFCRMYGAKLHVLHVMENYFLRPIVPDPQTLEFRAHEQLEELLTDDDRRALHATAIVDGSDLPADVLIDYAPQHAIDLIVLGTHGRRRIDRLLMGSVAERVVRLAPCPVLIVHHPERNCLADESILATAAM
jgi:nucleotide-binding universal stress UspA family protein